MSHKTHLKPDLIAFYLSGKSITQCADKFDVSIPTVSSWLKSEGIKRRPVKKGYGRG